MRAKTLPSANFVNFLFSISQDSFSRVQDYGRKSFLSRTPKVKLPFSPKILLAFIGVIVFIAVVVLFRGNQNSSATQSSSEKPAAPIIKAEQTLNKTYNFPIRDDSGKELNKLKFEILSASLQDEILVKGQRATAVQGRTFLILDLKIVNSYDKGVQINTRDYLRLIVNGNKNEPIAADIHNDPVEVQAISAKQTRIGFPINESYKNLELQVGEINGKKETIKLNLK
jgi:hypothetical protein